MMEGERELKRPRLADNSGKQPLLVFAHGAGAPSSSEWMIRSLIEGSSCFFHKSMLSMEEVARHSYKCSGGGDIRLSINADADIAGGKKGAPPKAEKLVDFHLEQVHKVMERHPGHPVVLLGKSMGSRVSCMVAAKEGAQVAAVICLGYPLKGANGALRDQTLLELGVPVMFVQGTRDALCPLDNLEDVMKRMTTKHSLHIIEGGDHSFKVPKGTLKRNNYSQEDVELQAVNAIQVFLLEVLGRGKDE